MLGGFLLLLAQQWEHELQFSSLLKLKKVSFRSHTTHKSHLKSDYREVEKGATFPQKKQELNFEALVIGQCSKNKFLFFFGGVAFLFCDFSNVHYERLQ